MRLGARDVVSLSATERVQAVVSRELRTFRLERALNSTLQSASDYRRQLQSVLQRSNDAILQVQEGIVVDANQTWLELFGYADAGAVVGQPLMDLFDDRSHAALKGALVACAQGKWSDHPLKVTSLLGDGTQLQLDLVLTPGEFENEPCVRIMVPAKKRDERQLTTELTDAVKRDRDHRPAAAPAAARRHRRAHRCAAGRRRALHGAGAPRQVRRAGEGRRRARQRAAAGRIRRHAQVLSRPQ